MGRRLDRERAFSTITPPVRGIHAQQDGRYFGPDDREVDPETRRADALNAGGGAGELSPADAPREPIPQGPGGEPTVARAGEGDDDPAARARVILEQHWFAAAAEIQELTGVYPQNKDEGVRALEQYFGVSL